MYFFHHLYYYKYVELFGEETMISASNFEKSSKGEIKSNLNI